MVYAPKALNLPLFLSTRLKQKPKNDKLIEYILSQSIYQKCEPRYIEPPERIKTKPQPKCVLVPKDARSLVTSLPYHLPPNRYMPKLEFVKPGGTKKGSYWSMLARKPDTIIHHLQKYKYLGTHRFYNLFPSREKCIRGKSKFLTNSRIRKPTNRLMINDPILCYRDPNEPGPAHYHPMNYTLEKNISPKKIPKKPLVYRFGFNSSVPSKETYLDKYLNNMSPGPGRFNPVSVIASPVKNCIYEPDMAYKIHMEEIKKYRHLPYKKFNFNYCEDPRIRNIAGHGHTYRFRGQEKYKSQDSSKKQSKSTQIERPMYMTLTYRQMINNPARSQFSFRDEFDIKPKTKPLNMQFHSLSKPVVRRKTKENQKVAFLSGVPRWKEEAREKVLTKDEEKEKPKKKPVKEPIKKKKESKYAHIKSRLSYLPERMRHGPMLIREKYFLFTNIPQPKILIRKDEFGNYGNRLLYLYTKQSTLDNYFKI